MLSIHIFFVLFDYLDFIEKTNMSENLQELFLAKAEELFNVCDKEQKGFIIKKDMQRLRDELGVEPEQLEDVFDSLDIDHNGYLTFEEFTCKIDFKCYSIQLFSCVFSWFWEIFK